METRQELCDKMADLLPEIRRILGVSQQELAEMAGVSRQTITNCERHSSPMRWTLCLAVMMLCLMNPLTRELLKLRGWSAEAVQRAAGQKGILPERSIS